MKTTREVKAADKLVRFCTKKRDAILQTVIGIRDDRDAFVELHKDVDLEEIDYYQHNSEDVAIAKEVAIAETILSKEAALNRAMRDLVKAHDLVMKADAVLYSACEDDAIAAEAEWEEEQIGCGSSYAFPRAASPNAPSDDAKAPGGKFNYGQVRDIVREVGTNPSLGREIVLNVLDQEGRGAKSVSSMKPDNLDRVYEVCRSLLAGKSASAEAGQNPHVEQSVGNVVQLREWRLRAKRGNASNRDKP